MKPPERTNNFYAHPRVNVDPGHNQPNDTRNIQMIPENPSSPADAGDASHQDADACVWFDGLDLFELKNSSSPATVTRGPEAEAIREASPAIVPSPHPLPTRPSDRSVASTVPQRGNFLPRELAARWGVSIDKVLGFIRSGDLRAFNVASKHSKRPRYRITAVEVERFEQETRASVQATAPVKPVTRRRKSSNASPPRRTYF